MAAKALLKNNLLCAETGDAVDMTETADVAMRALVTALDHELPVSKKSYVELSLSFATDVQSPLRELAGAARKLADQEVEVGELELLVHILADDTGKVRDPRKQLSAGVLELAFMEAALDAEEATL